MPIDEAERRRIIEESRELLDRPFAPHQPSEATPPAGRTIEGWRRQVEARECEIARARAQRRSQTDAGRAAATEAQLQQKIDAAAARVQNFVGAVVEQVIAHERSELAAALEKRDCKIEKLEVELVKAQAEIAKLNARVIEMSVDRDQRHKTIDWNAARSGLN